MIIMIVRSRIMGAMLGKSCQLSAISCQNIRFQLLENGAIVMDEFSLRSDVRNDFNNDIQYEKRSHGGKWR
jgi:hypothetical protein